MGLIQKHHAHSWCIVHSFEDKVLEDVHRIDPKIVLHSVTATRRLKPLRTMPYISEISIYYRFATPKWIEKVHRAGKKVNVWTVNEPKDMAEMIKMGVDGIISNNPDKVKKQVE